MFYASTPSKALRFGDIIRGFFSSTPVIKEPPFSLAKNYSIELSILDFYVIMDPCCQIRNSAISITPLVPLSCTLFENPYLAEDMTRLNRIMKPENSVPPHVWNDFSEEEKARRLSVGEKYAFVTLFVYEQNDRLPKQTCTKGKEKFENGYYVIDFRKSHRVNCDKIITPEKAPLDLKLLELSDEMRQQLSDKIISYYAIE